MTLLGRGRRTARQRSGNRGIVMAVTGNWKLLASLVFASSLAGCAASARMISGLPPVPVSASGETQPVGTNRADAADRSEEHTSELQSLMRISYAVTCLKKRII